MNIDLVFSLDETGSMRPCTYEARRNIRETSLRLFRDIPGLRIGFIAHGDYYDYKVYITKHMPLTDDPNNLVHFLENLESVNGGDAPEAYEMVLHEAHAEVNWRPEAQKVLVMVGDEVPHGYRGSDRQARYDWLTELSTCASYGIMIHGVQCLNNRHASGFYSALASATGGKHLTLQQFSDITHLIHLVAYNQQGSMDGYVTQLQEEGLVTRGISDLIDQLTGKVSTYTGYSTPSYRRHLEPMTLDAVSPYRFQILTTPYHQIAIRDFVILSGAKFKTGKGFYQFTKPETIQHNKEVVLRDKVTGDMFSGNKAKEMAGIPIGVTSRVRPNILDQYDVFVQSTSYNRKLMPGTKFLYEVEEWRE